MDEDTLYRLITLARRTVNETDELYDIRPNVAAALLGGLAHEIIAAGITPAPAPYRP